MGLPVIFYKRFHSRQNGCRRNGGSDRSHEYQSHQLLIQQSYCVIAELLIQLPYCVIAEPLIQLPYCVITEPLLQQSYGVTAEPLIQQSYWVIANLLTGAVLLCLTLLLVQQFYYVRS